jgi:hypothetical protein
MYTAAVVLMKSSLPLFLESAKLWKWRMSAGLSTGAD